MQIVNNIKSFLYDQNYFISLYKNNIHLYNYEKIITFSDKELVFKFTDFIIKVNGKKLLVKKMLHNEILIKGVIESIKFDYE